MFDSYTDKLEYSLKAQERSDRAGSTPPLQMHIGEICHKTLQDINYQEFLSNSEDKSPLLKKLTEYLTQESTRKDLMGCTTLNIEKDTVLISQSQQKIIFTSTQEEADTRIAIHCTESSKPVFGKSKIYRYINFNGVCFCFDFSTIWLVSTDIQWQDCQR